jgi:membrane fusion protein, multidrug efflux system
MLVLGTFLIFMKNKIFFAIVIVVAVFIGLAGVKVLQIVKMINFGKTFQLPPETISSAVAQEQKWQDTLTAVGSISAAQGVTVAAEVAGTVTEITFDSGAVVAKGDLLVRLDTSSEAAQLRAAEAQAELTRLNVERLHKLRESNVVSQSEVDTAEAGLKQNQANADSIRAIIEKKTIRAPFGGRLGIRLVNLGESLDARQAIVSLQSLVPVYGDFSLPQQTLSVLTTGLVVQVSSDAYPGVKFTGAVTAINPELDSITRAVRLQATFANTNQLLRPGMFARMEIVLPGEQTVLAVPATAILSAPFGDSVYIIEPSTNSAGGLVARQQFVKTGRPLGDFVSIVTGLKPGERVASSGLFKLRNGVGVLINNDIAPKSSTTPNPPNG